MVITGEIGAGKTTVSRTLLTLLNKIEGNTKIAMITNTHITQKELIEQILDELEVDYTPGGKQKLIKQLNKFLIEQLSLDVNVVLIIDEAQNLTSKVLEEIRMLSNLETEKEKLLQIILMGQPQLKTKLAHIKLEQFKQRIAINYHINSLTKEETHEYIKHRIKLVLHEDLQIFTPEAIDAIFSHSNGTPRIINLICDSALLSGYIYETKTITASIIHEIIKERELGHKSDSMKDIQMPDSI